MAFVFKSERKTEILQNPTNPGPGQYIGPLEYQFPENQAPFLANTTRSPRNSQDYTEPLQDIDYRFIIKNATRGEYSRKPVDTTEISAARPSANFRSKKDRFSYQIIKDTPGPGSYRQDPGIEKRNIIPPIGRGKTPDPTRVLPRNKSVPSIPSHIHSHGYCEAPDGNLLLNEQPLDDIQQLAGARCHEMKDVKNFRKVKGAPWSKSSEKTVQSYIPKIPTSDAVGPGTYELKDSSRSSESRLSFVFNSKIDRTCEIKMRRSNSTVRSRYRPSLPFRSLLSAAPQGGEDDDEEEEEQDEYAKNATPGPGYYYNESTASSFYSKATSILNSKNRKNETDCSGRFGTKEPKVEPLGGATERFKDPNPATGEIGPGQYQVTGNLVKKDIAVKNIPFHSANTRFDQLKVSDGPGPGAYQKIFFSVLKLGKNFKSKSQLRLRANDNNQGQGLVITAHKVFALKSKIEQGLYGKSSDPPGPGSYDPKVLSDVGKGIREGRESYIFASRREREPLLSNENPPVGSYAINHFDIASKVIKEEEELEAVSRKPAFNTSTARFKEKKADDSDDDDEEINWNTSRNLQNALKSRISPKNTAVFSSQVRRMSVDENKKLIPGPGSYHDDKINSWNRRTFNVNFSKI